MIRRAAWRAVGLTELPAAQRKRSRLHGRAAPFRGRTAPEAGEVVAAPRRASAHRSAAARRGAAPAAPGRRPRALATGAGASERAAAAVAPVARAVKFCFPHRLAPRLGQRHPTDHLRPERRLHG